MIFSYLLTSLLHILPMLSSFFFFFSSPGAHRDLHSFPTRRSSDLAWLMGGSVVLDGGQPRLVPSGMPDNRLMLFPAAAVRISDTWDVAGLRGTGSHDIAVDDCFVPAARSLSLISDQPRARGPLYAFPVFGLLALGIAAVALGIARRALDE